MLDLDNLEKAQRMSLTMQVEMSLKSALIAGALKPGARLVTKEIADKLGTSITPVREALLRLVSAGALHATPAQAFLVPEVSLERYREVNAIRKTLEGMAAEEACLQMSAEKLTTLRNLSEKFHEAMHNGEVERALHANRAFRFTLYHYAGMPTLMSLIEQLWVRIGPCFNCLYDENIDLPSSTYRYDALLRALEKGDVEGCRTAIDKVIDEANDILILQYLS
ncbi:MULTISPECIES: GntR family transcriptional regulator [Leclercia]|uniref:GntR family transcriptional regulator n=1 Tax=Leclercia pneumoniae TaxID=2815358 RepID=A0ABX8K0M4_9ENTR|nr:MULTISPECIES: GntR family transcriptional regulator [Leclercia]KKY88589.1 GntR family transcriptional regulator [Enterobacter cloacae]MBM6605084.1 GntR family transcriptional regulator [Enterobacteriaceae bacterium RIT 814]MBS0850666.1 GntR family transcriptional regulator [Enterobacter sp. JGM127]MCE6964427.1 GntR family transcriptional regulator [Enterobacter sp. MW07]MEB7499534.1 GntR family transcriptional regulator [Leclercia pneumoniae]